ncbi:uncharacterized protein BCR38DRAFT_408601 [Pseudomassariella vexata]|uniref:Uncharacterized protein n=1 Tax=Pseudomassariella vexata TaxID=1141098 RepID=A0A1Y2E0F8_9PEZI|nr:uncharacterized protein BCR38DRAFT_408601 [Pseudomassariella vexata]ORY64836.1 hypothetical protein BCR38DRAFT_408601 [Pseudomassariella vexata]
MICAMKIHISTEPHPERTKFHKEYDEGISHPTPACRYKQSAYAATRAGLQPSTHKDDPDIALEMVQLILKHTLNTAAEDLHNMAAIYFADWSRVVKVVELIINAGMNWQPLDKNITDAFHHFVAA